MTTLSDMWFQEQEQPLQLAYTAAALGYAPPPYLAQNIVQGIWEGITDKDSLLTKGLGTNTQPLDNAVLAEFGLVSWCGLPLILTVVHSSFLEAIPARLQTSATSVEFPDMWKGRLALLSRGWLPKQIAHRYQVSEMEVRRIELAMRQRFEVEKRVELALVALLIRAQKGRLRYP